MTTSYFPQEFNPIEKKTLAKLSEVLLIRANEILILSFMTLDMDLVMMSDKNGILWCLVMLSFMPWSIYLE